MLGKSGKEDDGGIKMLRIPRASFNVNTTPAPSTPSSFNQPGHSSKDIGSKDIGPDIGTSPTGSSLLSQVGASDLLEQDDRPTFIIDLGNQATFEPGPLKILFANVSLRTSDGLLDMVIGRVGEGSSSSDVTTEFNEFKAWSVGLVRNHESLDISSPSFSYAGVTWTCCSLKRRLRLIRGSIMSAAGNFGSNLPLRGFPGALESREIRNAKSQSSTINKQEPSDYFGDAAYQRSLRSSPADGTREGTISPSGFRESTYSLAYQDSKPKVKQKFSIGPHSKSSSPAISPLDSRPNEFIHRTDAAGQLDHSLTSTAVHQGLFDWTRLPNTPALPSHIHFVRSINWASTPLGSIEGWSAEFRGFCNFIMACPHPAAIYWGEEFTIIYNEAFIPLVGSKHPRIMGQRYCDAWPESWDVIKPFLNKTYSTGQATMEDDDCLFIERSDSPGFLEETYFSWSLVPLIGANGSVAGVYNYAIERTRQKIAERRMLTLKEVGEKSAAARELTSFWDQLLKGLECNDMDVPFAILYSMTDESHSDLSLTRPDSDIGSKLCVFEGSLGVPPGHPATPPQIELNCRSEFLANLFRRAMKTSTSILLQTADGTLDAMWMEGITWRGFGDPCGAAVCCPIRLNSNDSALGFLILGINPRRPYDNDYDLFIQLLTQQISTSMASVVLFQEGITRATRAAQPAAMDHDELSGQSPEQTHETIDKGINFSHVAEYAPVGIFIANPQGRVTYVNSTWCEITKVRKEDNAIDTWMDCVKHEDKEMVRDLWSELVDSATAINAEFRLEACWEGPNGSKGDTWVLASAYPEKDPGGNLKGIYGSLTNISRQKWAEYVKKRRLEEAMEVKRQQENFVDITSHEMRNPLSAILQCADEISTTLSRSRSLRQPAPQITADIIDNSIDAAQTIALCAQHQKRIVDDILTLSKLDSALLLVTPTDVMPISVVQRALKMFDGEVQKADIKLDLKIDHTIRDSMVTWVKLDPSRLLQVLINLITNAIKFTTSQEKRIITVTLGASLARPLKESFHGVSYFPSRIKREDLTQNSDWGDGEQVFIHFAVQDTGRGLTEDETKLLFHRFSQASPRTHVQYGGSGLGLFISRELVELQGGEIGVCSKAGEGSTFAFYIKVRRSTAPPEALNHLPTAGLGKSPQVKPPNPRSATPSTARVSKAKESLPKCNLKVLIVEDNLVNQRVLQKQLQNLGCEVSVANHGGECLEHLQKSTFWAGCETSGLNLTVILMDVEMPVMDGLECAHRIRELQQTGQIIRHVPIVAVSGNVRSEQINRALDAGMACFSPFNSL